MSTMHNVECRLKKKKNVDPLFKVGMNEMPV